MCRDVCLWHTGIVARGPGAAQGPLKPEGPRCSEMHSQPYLRPFFGMQGRLARAQLFSSLGVRGSIIFFSDYQGSIIFLKEFQDTIIFFNSIHGSPRISNGQCFIDAQLSVERIILYMNTVYSNYFLFIKSLSASSYVSKKK